MMFSLDNSPYAQLSNYRHSCWLLTTSDNCLRCQYHPPAGDPVLGQAAFLSGPACNAL